MAWIQGAHARSRCAGANVALLLGALWLGACGGASLQMRAAARQTVAAPRPDTAQVVFVLPSPFRDVVGLVDERGVYLGQLGARTWTVSQVAPGPHRFYALVGADAHVVHGTLEAGRTYWVVAEHDVLRGLRWVAWEVPCGDDEAGRLRGARAVEVDPAASTESIRRHLGDIPQRMLEADRELEALSASQRALRHLLPACEVAAVASPSTGPASGS